MLSFEKFMICLIIQQNIDVESLLLLYTELYKFEKKSGNRVKIFAASERCLPFPMFIYLLYLCLLI